MSLMDHATRICILFLYFIIGWTKDSDLKYCMGISTCGYTVPSGDIILKYGEPLNITCNLYPKFIQNGENSSSLLYFKRGDKLLFPKNNYDILNERDERVEVLNSTSIRLTIRKPETMKDFFYCYCNNTGRYTITCSNSVIVGVPPQNITNFTCRAENWEYVTCNWDLPENYVQTDYKVWFSYPEYINPKHGSTHSKKANKGILKDMQIYKVTSVPSSDSGHKKMNFTLTAGSEPFYRPAQETYHFFIRMTNHFGVNEQDFIWNHFENMYLKPPVNLIGVSTSPSDISVTWTLSTLPVFPKNLVFRIMYKCEKFCESWKLEKIFTHKPNPKQTDVTYNLTNLEYAHELYDIRVSVKVENSSDKTWSENSTKIIKTQSKIPDYPPPTTLGSFQFVNTQPRQVYVYFQQIQPQAENGEDFKYVVESNPLLNMTELTSAYAKFVGLKETRYTMKIWSENRIGRSKKYSSVVIPSTRVKNPYRLWKIVHTNVKYELEWEEPRDTQVTNYTLFWCEYQTDRPYQCMGFLNWTVVPSSIYKYNITVLPSNKIYQFAIAANTNYGSSGMHWASCTILANRTPSKINELLVKSVGSTYIELNWRQDCPDLNSEVIGYVIYYCTTNVTFNDTCSTPMKNITIDGSLSDQSGTVRGLTPYTTYMLAVSVKTKSTVGAHSDFVRNVTLEDAPSSPPLNISFSEITNSSVIIHWMRPVLTNGKIKNYHIYYNNKEKEIPGESENYTLTDLESFKEYGISMDACTVHCSKWSNKSFIFTKMGTPSKPGRPYLNVSNDHIAQIGWNKPDFPRGEIQYYQIYITHGSDNSTGELINGTNAELFTFEYCGGKSKYDNYNTIICVRAVNVIDNEHYPGPWSEPFNMSSCYKNSWLMLYIAIGVVAVIIMGFGGKKLYACYIAMRDVGVKLPAGLDDAVEHSEKNVPDNNKYADEELLLNKLGEKCPVGDSSGCSSGQESIASSVESTTHLSIDSGTDQPGNVTEDNRENSLRLRNVPNKGYVLHEPIPPINRGTKPTSTPPGNYCVLGQDLSNKPLQDTPYVTISDMENTTSTCISNEKLPIGQPPYTDFFKTPNPGYVPFSNTEPGSKNTGYVLAGDLSSPPIEHTTSHLLSNAPVVGLKPSTVWQQPAIEQSLTKPGYVTVGDAPPPVTVKESSMGYVSHRQFEAKSLKED